MIDYTTVSLECASNIKSSRVGEEIFSDHMPLELEIQMCSVARFNSDDTLPLLPELRWQMTNVHSYRTKVAQVGAIPENEDQALECTRNLILEASGGSSHGQVSRQPAKQPWFDNECRIKWGRVLNYLIYTGKQNSELVKRDFLTANKEYKNICVEKKKEYLKKLTDSLKEVRDTKISGE